MASGAHKFLLVPDSGSADIRRLLMMVVLIVFTCCCSSTVTKPEQAATGQTSPSQASPTAQPKAKDDREPEIVRVEKVINGPQVKVVLVGNKNGQYSLSCNANAESCLTPTPGVDYYVITKDTKWRLKGAEGEITLTFIQDFTVSYNNSENIGLVAVELNQRGRLAIYWLNSWTGK